MFWFLVSANVVDDIAHWKYGAAQTTNDIMLWCTRTQGHNGACLKTI
jgi:hypothetical protein